MSERAELIAVIHTALEPLEHVHTLFEAGSASFARDDEFSDIDLVADVTPGQEELSFAVLEAALAAYVHQRNPAVAQPFLARKLIPLPAWHGMQQRFYKLAGVSEWLLLDIALRPADKPELFAEPERHGTARVLFDKQGLIRPAPLDLPGQQERMRQRLAELRENLILFGNFAEKECRRGHALDALAMYHSMLLRPLAELLRMKHDRARFDFGLRYLDFDLPPAVHARLTALAFPADLAMLELAQAEARAWMAQLLIEVETDA